MVILAIESSCDETSAAIIKDDKLLANVIATQEIHHKYGGVVPELASRAHQQNLIPVVHQAIKEAKIQKSDVNTVAFTRGPGLLGALLVGISFAKSFAQGLNVPLIEVNHMEAHVLAHFIEEPRPEFPFLCLTISGGHTQLVRVDEPTKMTVIGETMDDAVGEAFDKTAKLLGLDYPGGPLIDKFAKEGNPDAFDLPNTNVPDLSYSFSGIKTGIRNFLIKNLRQNENFITENMNDICASIQKKFVDMLFAKLVKAAKQEGIKNVAIAGGVAANSEVRSRLKSVGEKQGWETFIPKFEYCTDNAAMIAIAAKYKFEKKEFVDQSISADPRMKIGS
jgi:N6-L-threonylcarbamoyladenine synthase